MSIMEALTLLGTGVLAGIASTVAGARSGLSGQREQALRLAMVTAIGGTAGAGALLIAPASTFAMVVPVPWFRITCHFRCHHADYDSRSREDG